MKTIEVTIGKELQQICEQGQAAILSRSAEPSNVLHDIKQQLEKITGGSSGHAVSDTDSLLEEIKHGQVNIPYSGSIMTRLRTTNTRISTCPRTKMITDRVTLEER